MADQRPNGPIAEDVQVRSMAELQSRSELLDAVNSRLLRELHDDPRITMSALARRVVALPVLLLATYRSDEGHPALTHLLASLDRERDTTELDLGRLAAATHTQLHQHMRGVALAAPTGSERRAPCRPS